MARLGPALVCHSDLFDEVTICRDVFEAPGEEEGQEGDAGPSVCGPGCGGLLARSLELLAMDVQLLPPALDVALRADSQLMEALVQGGTADAELARDLRQVPAMLEQQPRDR